MKESKNLLLIHELNNKLQQELIELAEEYTTIMHKIALFAESNNISKDEVLDFVEEWYEEDLTYGDN